MTDGTATVPGAVENPTDEPAIDEPRLGRAATTITIWNLVARITGFVRVIAIASALGIVALGDTYQRTNQVTNVLFELLAGGMLFAVLMPTFVDVLRRNARTEARQLAGALTTRAVAALSVLVIIGMVFSEPIMQALSAGVAPSSRQAQVELGTFLLRFILPQLLLYTIGAVASALLQSDHRFAPTSMAPAFNNIVVTATMIAFAASYDPARGLDLTTGEKVLLGGGTLLGTLAMTIVPLLALWQGGLGIRPAWRVPDADLRGLARRGLWGAGHVGLNEVMMLATVFFAGWVNGGVIAFQTAFTFFLLPHALLAHPIFTALYPRLSRQGAAGDLPAFARNLSLGLRSMVFLLLPATGLMAVAVAPALSIFQFGQLDDRGTRLVALILASYLLGLVGYSTFFLLTRASYALDDARTPTVVNLAVTVGSVGGMGLATALTDGTTLLVSFGFINAITASFGSWILYRHICRHIGRPVPILATLLRGTAGTVAATGAAFGITATIGWHTTIRALAAAGGAAAVGGAVYVAVLAAVHSPELTMVQRRVKGLTAGRRR